MNEACEIHKIEMEQTECRRCNGNGENRDDEDCSAYCGVCKGSGVAPYLICRDCEDIAREKEL